VAKLFIVAFLLTIGNAGSMMYRMFEAKSAIAFSNIFDFFLTLLQAIVACSWLLQSYAVFRTQLLVERAGLGIEAAMVEGAWPPAILPAGF
jgi:hypothetical protein